MKIEENVRMQLVEKYFSQKKYKAERADITEKVNTVCDFIESTDLIGEFDTQFDDKSLDSIVIPEELKDFVNPTVVRISQDDYNAANCLDMDALRCEKKDGKYISTAKRVSYDDYHNALAYLRGLSKLSPNDKMIKLSSLKIVVTLATALASASFGGKAIVKSDSSGYVPIPLNPTLKGLLFKPNKPFMDLSYTIQIYFETLVL